MENADQNKYGLVLKGLTEQYSLDQDHYLKTINHATNVLSNHKFDEKVVSDFIEWLRQQYGKIEEVKVT
jgi:hypothetical protein